MMALRTAGAGGKRGGAVAHVVVDARDAPHAADVAVRVAAVELVLVVEVDRRVEGLLRGGAPLEDLLRPVHAHEAVHLAEVHHLALRRVPDVLVRLRRLKLRPACPRNGSQQHRPGGNGLALTGQGRWSSRHGRGSAAHSTHSAFGVR